MMGSRWDAESASRGSARMRSPNPMFGTDVLRVGDVIALF